MVLTSKNYSELDYCTCLVDFDSHFEDFVVRSEKAGVYWNFAIAIDFEDFEKLDWDGLTLMILQVFSYFSLHFKVCSNFEFEGADFD